MVRVYALVHTHRTHTVISLENILKQRCSIVVGNVLPPQARTVVVWKLQSKGLRLTGATFCQIRSLKEHFNHCSVFKCGREIFLSQICFLVNRTTNREKKNVPERVQNLITSGNTHKKKIKRRTYLMKYFGVLPVCAVCVSSFLTPSL